MVSPVLISELEEIIGTDYGIKLDKKELTEIADSLIRFFGLLITVDKNEKPKVTTKK